MEFIKDRFFHNGCSIDLIDLSKSKYKRIERPDIDPYGEDDWGSIVQESNHNIIIIKDILKKHDNYDDFMKEIESLIIGEKVDVFYPDKDNNKIYKKYKTFIITKITRNSLADVNYDSLLCDARNQYGELVFRINSGDDSIYVNDKLVVKNIERKYSELDPYGEEEWEDDEKEFDGTLLNENFDLKSKLKDKDTAIVFKDSDEMVRISDELKELGFIVYNYDKIKTWRNTEGYCCFACSNNIKVDFSRGGPGAMSHRENKIDFIEFMIMVNKNFRRIERPDVDPYNEEDWGYVQDKKIYNYKEFVNENKKEIILVKDILKKNNNYEDFIKEIRELIIGKEILIYEFKDETRRYHFFKKLMVKSVTSGNSMSKIPGGITAHYNKLFSNDQINVANINGYPTYSTDKFIINNNITIDTAHLDIDPYGEEDWDDFENILND